MKEWNPPKDEQKEEQCLEAIEHELLLRELYYGFRILPLGVEPADLPGFKVANYDSTCEKGRAAITKTIRAELAAGILRVLPQEPKFCSSIYSKDESKIRPDGTVKEKFRIITDFSMPAGQSVNDHSDHMHFSLMGHEDFQALLCKDASMAKADLAAAYRSVGVLPNHAELLSFEWELDGVRVYIGDSRAPFGLAKTPEFFNRLTLAVRAILAARGFPECVVFFDDFGLVLKTAQRCLEAREALSALIAELGWTESIPKREGPTNDMTMLGVRYQTAAPGEQPVRASVPEDKLRKAEEWASRLQGKPTASRKDLEKARGFFQHLSHVVWASRGYLRRITDAITAAGGGSDRTQIKITRAIQLDLRFWAHMARKFNGEAVLLQEPIMAVGLMSTDASDWGMGGFLNGRYFSIGWKHLRQAVQRLPITSRKLCKLKLWPKNDGSPKGGPRWAIHYRELFTVFWAILEWGPTPELGGRTAVSHQDNTTVEYDFNKFDSPNAEMSRLLRHCYKALTQFRSRLTLTRITSAANILADALSRDDWATFHRALEDWRAGRNQPDAPKAYSAPVFRSRGGLLHRAAEARAAGRGP